jgi:hypothetical protein
MSSRRKIEVLGEIKIERRANDERSATHHHVPTAAKQRGAM